MKKLFLTSAIVLALTGAALAQNNSKAEGLVNLSLGDVVIQDIANDLDVTVEDVANIVATVQVPIGVAANLCGIDANVLAQQKSAEGPIECAAESSTEAFSNLVQRNLKKQ